MGNQNKKCFDQGVQRLYSPCPIKGCRNQNDSMFWIHEECGGLTHIRYDDITLLCSKCDREGDLFDWKFKCQQHKYQKSSRIGWNYALAVMAQQQGSNQKGIQNGLYRIKQRLDK